jgi:hypothetical protein
MASSDIVNLIIYSDSKSISKTLYKVMFKFQRQNYLSLANNNNSNKQPLENLNKIGSTISSCRGFSVSVVGKVFSRRF